MSVFDQANMLVMGRPNKVPKYKPSDLEKEYEANLKKMMAGDFPGFTPGDEERRYAQLKDKLLPEYERLGKETDVWAARRGIEGGSLLKRKYDLQDQQLADLIKLRQEVENQTNQLKLMASQNLGQLGMGRSDKQYQSEMADFQSRLAEYDQLQQNIAGLLGMGGQLAAGGNMPLPSFPQSQMKQPSYNYNPNFLDTDINRNRNYPRYG